MDPRILAGMRVQLAARRAEIDAGAHPLGWKLGLGGPAALESLGTTGALAGYLIEGNRLADGASVAIGSWTAPRFEPELAVRLDASGAIDAVAVAIELADLQATNDVEEILGANIFQRHVILGPAHPPATTAVRSVVTLDGEQIATTDDPFTPGDPAALATYLADYLGAAGESLRAGDWLITGAIFPPMPIAPGQTLAHHLDPLGAVSVSLVE